MEEIFPDDHMFSFDVSLLEAAYISLSCPLFWFRHFIVVDEIPSSSCCSCDWSGKAVQWKAGSR